MLIVDRLFSIMKSKNLKMADLAQMLGINKSVVSTWKSRSTNPPVEYTDCICNFLGISYEFYLNGYDNNESPILPESMQELSNNDSKETISKAEQGLLIAYRELDFEQQYKLHGFMRDLDRENSDRNIREAMTKGKQYTFDLPFMEGHKNPIKK